MQNGSEIGQYNPKMSNHCIIMTPRWPAIMATTISTSAAGATAFAFATASVISIAIVTVTAPLLLLSLLLLLLQLMSSSCDGNEKNAWLHVNCVNTHTLIHDESM